MSHWDKLKSRFQSKDRDLEAEFEQFLNESLSEESVSSPRSKPRKEGLKVGRGVKTDTPKPGGGAGAGSLSKPWWESSVEDESTISRDNVGVDWFKKTATVAEEDENDEEVKGDGGRGERITEEQEEEVDPRTTTHQQDGNLDIPETVGVSVTMSKDSLDDGPKDVEQEHKQNEEVESVGERPSSAEEVLDEKDEDHYSSYTEPSGTAPTTSASSEHEIPADSTGREGDVPSDTGEHEVAPDTGEHEIPPDTGEHGVPPDIRQPEMPSDTLEEQIPPDTREHQIPPDTREHQIPPDTREPALDTMSEMNTQQELEEKQEFFKKLEKDKSSLDYGKLNEILDQDTSATTRTGDLLQATGVELGNSIFNTTGFGGREVTMPDKKDDLESPNKSLAKPSMLAKVSLMDTLDSSMGTAQRQKIKQIRKKQIDTPEDIGDTEMMASRDQPMEEDYSVNVDSDHNDDDMVKGGTALLNTSAANELADLHRALKDAQMISTHGHGERQRQESQESEPVITEKNMADNVHLPPSGISREVHQPVIATLGSKGGLSYSPTVSVPSLNHTFYPPTEGVALEQLGIILPRESGREPDKPVLGNLDVFLQARQTGFPSNVTRGFELPEKREPAPVDSRTLVHPSPVAVVTKATRSRDEHSEGDDQFGFSLRPVAVEAGSSDGDTPPADSLKGIKSIVKKRRETKNDANERTRGSPKLPAKSTKTAGKKGEKTIDARGKPARGKKESSVVVKRGSVETERSRYGWTGASRTSTPSRVGKTGTPAKERKKQNKTPQKSQAKKQSSPVHLIASVEKFANYLNNFVQGGDEAEPMSHAHDWLEGHQDERSLVESLAGKRLAREQALQKEVEHWQCMWHDERRAKEKLVDELTEKDREWKRREQTLGLDYKKEVNALKQQIFVLESKLKDVNAETDHKKRVAKGGHLKGMSDAELRKLEKEIREQEQLLSGYQQESERLCQALKDTEIKAKDGEKQMFRENQKLASEVASLKEKLERKKGVFGAAGAAAMGAERIHQLHTQVQVLKKNEQDMRKEIDDLEEERRQLKLEGKNLERERDKAVHRADDVQGTNSQTLQDLQSTHAVDVERLKRKLQWYVENQDLLDKDAAILKQKNDEIAELRDLVGRLEKERGQTTVEKDRKEKERAVDARRIQDLERQVREMEQIIKRRYPNSIPALIYAATSAPGDGKPIKADDSPKKSDTPSYAFLETRVQKLNRELEEREEEWARSFRVLEQKYNAMEFQYEGQVKELQRELSDSRDKVTSYTHTRAQTSSLEKELDAVREKHAQKTAQMNEEIRILRDALRASKPENAQTIEPKKAKKGKRDAKVAIDVKDGYEERLRDLSEECAQKNRVIEELKGTCAQLQRQREEMLMAERNLDQSLKTGNKNLVERLDVVNAENRQLRDQLSEMSVEMDQQRVRYQGSLAEVERIARQEREASHDELRSLRGEHRKQVETIREEYATEHSRSKMAEMANKIASLEIVIERLKDKLATSAQIEAELASHKVQEEILKQEIVQLKADVKKAKQFHSPEMQHYAQLEDKIVAMETRHSRREHELQAIIHKMRLSADVEKDEVLAKWRNLLRKKTEETERFRVELDAILSVLDDLRRQGVVIPVGKLKR